MGLNFTPNQVAGVATLTTLAGSVSLADSEAHRQMHYQEDCPECYETEGLSDTGASYMDVGVNDGGGLVIDAVTQPDEISYVSGSVYERLGDVMETVTYGKVGRISRQFLDVGGAEGESQILRYSQDAISALREIENPENFTYLAFVDETDGKIYVMNESDEGVIKSFNVALSMEDRYSVSGRPTLKHVASRTGDRYYVPYDSSYDVPEVRERGARNIQRFVDEAYEVLNNVDSKAFVGHSIAEVIPPEFLVNFLIIENISHININNPEVARQRLNGVLVNFALNGENTFAYRRSATGASGSMQLMPAMYNSVTRGENGYDLSERFGLPQNFDEGSKNIVASFIAAATLLDDIMRSYRVYGIVACDEPEQVTDEQYELLFGGYLHGARSFHALLQSGENDGAYNQYASKYEAISALR